MSQSALLVASLIALFVVFLAARGRLATYAGVFYGPKPAAPAAGGASKTSDSGGSSTVSTALTVAKVAAMFLA